jgi:hypothetical protein
MHIRIERHPRIKLPHLRLLLLQTRITTSSNHGGAGFEGGVGVGGLDVGAEDFYAVAAGVGY